MSTRVYVEGGGDTNPLKTHCRQAFRSFFSRAGPGACAAENSRRNFLHQSLQITRNSVNFRDLKTKQTQFIRLFGAASPPFVSRSVLRRTLLEGRLPRVFACGGRQQAYRDFCHALGAADDNDFVILLVDSEGPVAEDSGPWVHLKGRDNWDQPFGTTDENAHLMVQCMEAWFLADQDGLGAFFGHGFNRNALPGNPNTEDVAKADVFEGLKHATRQCQPKGEYGKGRHSFELISQIVPAMVLTVSPHARRLVEILREKA